jgi:hypothetical protein
MKPKTEAPSAVAVKTADAVWAATALLHRERASESDFALREIVDRVQAERRLGEHQRTTVYAHVTQHCVANVVPNSGKYRMLFETVKGRRRLFRDNDPYDHQRAGKTIPGPDALPVEFRSLLEWYRSEYAVARSLEQRVKTDPILAMRGLGKEIWADVDADEYVRQLREGWE